MLTSPPAIFNTYPSFSVLPKPVNSPALFRVNVSFSDVVIPLWELPVIVFSPFPVIFIVPSDIAPKSAATFSSALIV